MAAAAGTVSEVSLHELPNHTSASCTDGHHSSDGCHGAGDKSSMFAASSSSSRPSWQTKSMYQTDSLAPDRPCDVSCHSNNRHNVSRCNINTDSCSRLEAGMSPLLLSTYNFADCVCQGRGFLNWWKFPWGKFLHVGGNFVMVGN